MGFGHKRFFNSGGAVWGEVNQKGMPMLNPVPELTVLNDGVMHDLDRALDDLRRIEAEVMRQRRLQTLRQGMPRPAWPIHRVSTG